MTSARTSVDAIERLIKEIDTALNLLDRAGPGETVAE